MVEARDGENAGVAAGVAGPRSGGGGGWRGVAGFAVVVAVWGGAFFGSQKLVPPARAERTWSATSGTPVPSDFVFLMFPVDDEVPVYDSPGGKKVGVLERALGNDIGELRDSQWVQVPGGTPGAAGKSGYVRVEDLRYLSAAAAGTAVAPPEGVTPKRVNYVAAFAAAYMARAPGELRTVTFMAYTARPESLDREAEIGERAPGRYVVLSLKAGPNRRQFFAKVTPEGAVPLAIDRLSEGARLQKVVLKWIIAACVATLAAAVAGIGVLAVRRRGLEGRATGSP